MELYQKAWSRKGQKYTLFLDGGLVKGFWVIIDTPHPACRKGDLVGKTTINSPVVGGVPGYGFHPLPGPSRE